MNILKTLNILEKNCQAKKNSLRGKEFSDKGSEHALKVMNTFEMKTIKYYHDLYLKCDVLLLAGVFEKLRNNSLKSYRLCQVIILVDQF